MWIGSSSHKVCSSEGMYTDLMIEILRIIHPIYLKNHKGSVFRFQSKSKGTTRYLLLEIVMVYLRHQHFVVIILVIQHWNK